MNKTLKLTFIAAMVAICVVVNSLEINFVSFKISFTYIPTFIAGAFLGPVAGLLTGGIGDIIGSIIRPTGAYNPLFTLSTALMGLIPGLVFKFIKLKPIFNIVLSFLLVYVICTLGINTFAIYFYYLAPGSKTYLVFLSQRVSSQTPIVGFNMVICIILYYPLLFPIKKIILNSAYSGNNTKSNSNK